MSAPYLLHVNAWNFFLKFDSSFTIGQQRAEYHMIYIYRSQVPTDRTGEINLLDDIANGANNGTQGNDAGVKYAVDTISEFPDPEIIKIFFILNSVEHEILNARKYKNIKKFGFF